VRTLRLPWTLCIRENKYVRYVRLLHRIYHSQFILSVVHQLIALALRDSSFKNPYSQNVVVVQESTVADNYSNFTCEDPPILTPITIRSVSQVTSFNTHFSKFPGAVPGPLYAEYTPTPTHRHTALKWEETRS
jgi:hypothetical protein